MKQHVDKTGVRRPVVLLALLSLLALLVWLLWPVRVNIKVIGIVQPRFEDLVRVTPAESGMVCRVITARLQEVQAGEHLFEYIPAGKFSVLSYTRMTPPGGGDQQPEPLPNWYQKVELDRIARIDAANRWSGRVLSHVKNARRWESDLAQRMTMKVPREADLTLLQAQQNENKRLGRDNANAVYTFDEVTGQSVVTEEGIPFASPVAGTIFSLWVQPQTQIFGSPAAALPILQPGDPPRTAVHASTSSPVAEIMLPGTPLEVLALIPVPPRAFHRLEGWKAGLIADGAKVEIGDVSINPTDAGLIMPELSVSEDSVFVRVSLPANESEKIDDMVRFMLVSPLRPHAWVWLCGK